MISIKLSEQKIAELIEPQALATKYPNCPPFKLRVFPGDAFSLGKPVNCLTVYIKFKNIDFEEPEQFHQCCIGQINKCNWAIDILNHNLRAHQDTYLVAEAIIQELRGRYLLVNLDNDLIQGQSSSLISKYEFIDNTRKASTVPDSMQACYQSRIILSSRFTDKYDAESPI